MFRNRHAKLARMALANLHWVITAGLVLALVPAFSAAKLPFRVNWSGFVMIYWVGLTARSVFFAVLLYSASFPRKTIVPFWRRCCKQKPRFAFLALFAAIMLSAFGWNAGTILTVDIIAILELFERGDLARMRRSSTVILGAAAYLFVGLVLMMCYNDVIASLKYAGSYVEALNHLDALLFGGLTVPHLANAASHWLPERVFSLLGIVYFSMFGQVGTGLFITGFSGKKRAFQYVGALLTATYIALAIFYLWPTMGPFALGSASHQQAMSGIQQVQHALVRQAHALAAHQYASGVGTDYYIGFPCMHIANPLIVLWFLRKRKRIAALLIMYDVVLVAAIILLQWHFFSDLVGGVLVAALSIFLTARSGPTPEIDLMPVETDVAEVVKV